MKPAQALLARVEARDLLRELARRLVREAQARPCLRAPAVAPKLAKAISALDAVAAALVDDPTAGTLTGGTDACPICDINPELCKRGGECALNPDPRKRPEPWEFRVIALPREQMNTIDEAIARAKQIAAPYQKSDSAAVALVALDFVASNGFTNKSARQGLSLLVDRFEYAMGLRLIILDRKKKLLYGIRNLEWCVTTAPEFTDEKVP